MGFLDYFQSDRRGSASVAKERLQVIVARERRSREGADYLPALQQEILEVIQRYTSVDDEAVKVQVERDGDCEVLEVNVTLPSDH